MKNADRSSCVLAVLSLALVIPSMVWRGYVLSLLWGWFIAAKFAIPSLRIPEAIGLACVVSFLTYQGGDAKQEDRTPGEQFARVVVLAVLWPLLALAVGAVARLFL